MTKQLESTSDLAASVASFWSGAMMHPAQAFADAFKAGETMLNTVTNSASIEPERGDKRFKDPMWSSNPMYRTMMENYLTCAKTLDQWVEGLDLSERDKMRAKLLNSLAMDTLAPTNALVTNPTALKATIESRGQNLVKGMENFVRDMTQNNGLPSMVDKSKFEVGKNLGLSEGAVVYREEHLELIQYSPKTPEVYKVPVFIVPPQINKFYIWDLTEGRSIVEYLVSQGHQVFIVSWRNPTAEQSDWDLESYVEALDRATEKACEVSGSDKLNMVGACSGGITAALLMALWGARGVERAAGFSLFVSIIDVAGGENTTMGLFANTEVLQLARQFSRAKGILEGSDLERAFAWLRPNDLIWNYYVNNYLMGQDSPAFDILFWNADTTNLSAALHSDMLALLENGGMTQGNGPVIGGHKLDLSQITCDAYMVAGETDHITPWDGCFLTTQGYKGNWEFILSQSGHIQSLINPPGNPRAKFQTHPGQPATPEEFKAGAETHGGSWWPHWNTWLGKHGGEKIPAPKKLGSKTHKPLEAAPGTYCKVDA